MNASPTITASTDWRELLANPGERNHSVQLYSDLSFLTHAVSHYAGVGLARGEAVVFVAAPAHREAFANRLNADGYNVVDLTRSGQLTMLDAAETLSRFMADGTPDGSRFMPLIGEVIDQAQGGGRFPKVRAYGEMVNLLWEKGEMTAALQLEDLWNELGRQRPFSLHCAYAMDAFDLATCCGPLHGVHHAHSHLIPVEDYPKYDRAVSRAMSDVLGPTEARILKPLLSSRYRGRSLPGAQAALLGLSEVLPTATSAVLRRARRYYGVPQGRQAP